MHLFSGEQEAAEYLLAVFGVAATGEAAQITAQMLEPAFPQVRRAHTVSPARGKGKESEHGWQLLREFLDHLRCGPAPAGAETARPLACLQFMVRFPDPPKLSTQFPTLEPRQSWRQALQVAEPVG